jgi:hypothetical protein
VRLGAGSGGADRVTLIWDDNAIQNTWLRITAKAGFGTGLGANDVFYFANLIGDANGNGNVTVADVALTKSLNGQTADPSSAADFNRNGQITVADVAIAKAYQGNSIPMLSAPAAAPAPAPAAAPLAVVVNMDTGTKPTSKSARGANPFTVHPFSTTPLKLFLPLKKWKRVFDD